MRQVLMGICALGLLAGCGGSGGGGSGDGGLTNATLSGTYGLVSLGANQATPSYIGAFGVVVADGAGNFTTTGTLNNDKSVGSVINTTGVYTVQSNGALTVDADEAGGVQSTGRVAVNSAVTTGMLPAMSILMRRSGTYSDAMLTGNYHLGQLNTSSTDGDAAVWTTTAKGAIVADGAGALTFPPATTNQGGTIVGVGGAPASYSITPAGEFSMPVFGADAQGSITSGGSFALLGGGTSGAPTVGVLIKTGAGMSATAFNGSYWVVGMSSDPTDSGNWLAFHGTVTADGAGNMNYVSTTENFEGVISMPSGLDTYTVSSDGSLLSNDRIGAITPDGEYAFLCGSMDAMGTPMLFIFILK